MNNHEKIKRATGKQGGLTVSWRKEGRRQHGLWVFRLALVLLMLCCGSPGIMMPRCFVQAIPYMLLASTKPKCFMIITSSDMVILVKYHAPDVISMSSDTNNDEQDPPIDHENIPPDQLSKIYAERYKKKIQEMQKTNKQIRDMSITMTQRVKDKDGEEYWHYDHHHDGHDHKPLHNKRVHRELSEKRGQIVFTTDEAESPVRLCIQSKSATAASPSRLGLNVTEFYIEEWIEKEAQPKKKQQEEKKDSSSAEFAKSLREEANQMEAKHHLSMMEREVMELRGKISRIVSLSNSWKQNNHHHFQESLNFQRASMYTPLLHIVILGIVTVIQIILTRQFFQKRKLID